ncbi:hypothetical protein ACT3OH_19330 [Vreelandella zhanjiangensis]|nr:hypothetical protein [Halomonas hibernica]
MQTYRNTLGRFGAALYRFSQDSGVVLLPIIVVAAIVEVLL